MFAKDIRWVLLTPDMVEPDDLGGDRFQQVKASTGGNLFELSGNSEDPIAELFPEATVSWS